MRMHPRFGRPRVGAFVVNLMAATALTSLAGASRIAAQEPQAGVRQAVVTVKGMQCPFCAYVIQKQLKRLPGATKVEVELAKSQAIVSFTRDADVTDEQIQEAVKKAGFTAGEIEWRSSPKSTAGSQDQD